MKENQNANREMILAALKLIEQLYIDGQITRTEFIGILQQNCICDELEEIVSTLNDREAA